MKPGFLVLLVALASATCAEAAAPIPPTLTNLPPPDSATYGQVRARNMRPPRETERYRLLRKSSPDNLFARTVAGDHEAVGISFLSGSTYVGIEGWNVIYAAKDFVLQIPQTADAASEQFLYAPTARPPNGSCLELGTAYETLPGKPTEVSLYAFDFCTAQGVFLRWTPFDDVLLNMYTRRDGTNRLYYFRIIPDNMAVSASTKWTAELFNFQKNRWDQFASAQGESTDPRGWSIFETYFQPGQCSKSLPLLFASTIEVLDATTGAWKKVDFGDSLFVSTYDSSGPSAYCFRADHTGPASYLFSLVAEKAGWAVSSTGF